MFFIILQGTGSGKGKGKTARKGKERIAASQESLFIRYVKGFLLFLREWEAEREREKRREREKKGVTVTRRLFASPCLPSCQLPQIHCGIEKTRSTAFKVWHKPVD